MSHESQSQQLKDDETKLQPSVSTIQLKVEETKAKHHSIRKKKNQQQQQRDIKFDVVSVSADG